MKKLSILVLGLLFLSSCEKETIVDYFIDNQTSDSITVKGSDIVHATTLDYTIAPNEKVNISGWRKFGKETDLFEPVSMFGDDLVITNATGDTLLKDYKSLSNWATGVDNNRAVAIHEYILIINGSDF